MKSTMTVSNKGFNTPDSDINSFRKKMLNWYDKNQRTMPWRATKGQKPNAYHVWLSEVMLQQTTVATVGAYFIKFIARWPTIFDLAKADRDDVMHEWAGLGYYARARNLHKCAQQVVEQYDGVFPQDEKSLQALSGIGTYTSASIRSIAFDKESNVVDGNIERIFARLYAIKQPLQDSKKDLKKLAGFLTLNQKKRTGDYAQALMDLGATVCTPQSPKCLVCPIQSFCLANSKNLQNDIPVKKKKPIKPQKVGEVFWITNDKGEVLFEKRDEKEMLGGMIGLPTTPWKSANFIKKPNKAIVYHSFTHFDLKLGVIEQRHEKGFKKPEKEHFWVQSSKLGEVGVPTLFKKVIRLMNTKENL